MWVGLLPSDTGEDLVKRVIGVGGDHIVCCDAQERIVAQRRPARRDATSSPAAAPARCGSTSSCRAGRVFVMGDNRARLRRLALPPRRRAAGHGARSPTSSGAWSAVDLAGVALVRRADPVDLREPRVSTAGRPRECAPRATPPDEAEPEPGELTRGHRVAGVRRRAHQRPRRAARRRRARAAVPHRRPDDAGDRRVVGAARAAASSRARRTPRPPSREIAEETGFVLAPEDVRRARRWRRDSTYVRRHVRIWQHEVVVAARVAGIAPGARRARAARRRSSRSTTAHRWWSVEEIEASPARASSPAGSASLLRDVPRRRRDRRAVRPLELTGAVGSTPWATTGPVTRAARRPASSRVSPAGRVLLLRGRRPRPPARAHLARARWRGRARRGRPRGGRARVRSRRPGHAVELGPHVWDRELDLRRSTARSTTRPRSTSSPRSTPSIEVEHDGPQRDRAAATSPATAGSPSTSCGRCPPPTASVLVAPPDIADRLEELLRDGPPPAPVRGRRGGAAVSARAVAARRARAAAHARGRAGSPRSTRSVAARSAARSPSASCSSTSTRKSAPTGVRDSKLLTPAARERIVPRLRRWAPAWAVAHASAEEIDAVGILRALRLAGERAFAQLPRAPRPRAARRHLRLGVAAGPGPVRRRRRGRATPTRGWSRRRSRCASRPT